MNRCRARCIDVYKRQAVAGIHKVHDHEQRDEDYRKGDHECRILRRSLKTRCAAGKLQVDDDASDDLDVYKRQVKSSSPGTAPMRNPLVLETTE